MELVAALLDTAVAYIHLKSAISLDADVYGTLNISRSVTIVGSPSCPLQFKNRPTPALHVMHPGSVVFLRCLITQFYPPSLLRRAVIPADGFQGIPSAHEPLVAISTDPDAQVEFRTCLLLITDTLKDFAVQFPFWSLPTVVPYIEAYARDDEHTWFVSTVADGSYRITNSTVAADRDSCYQGGALATNAENLYAALQDEDTTMISTIGHVLLYPEVFSFRRGRVIYVNRSVHIHGCYASDIHVNRINGAVVVGSQGSLSISDLYFRDVAEIVFHVETAVFEMLFGFFDAQAGGEILIDKTAVNIRAHDAFISALHGTNHSVGQQLSWWQQNDSAVKIDTWLAATSGGGQIAGNGLNVSFIDEQCYTDFQGQAASNQNQLAALLSHGVVEHILVTSDMVFTDDVWPCCVQIPANRTIEIRACHPVEGQRYIIDLGLLSNRLVILGHLRWLGDLKFIHPYPDPQYQFLYLLPGFFSIQMAGTVKFQGVVIHGDAPSPLNNSPQDDRSLWKYQNVTEGIVPEVSMYNNVSWHELFIHNFEFEKALWVRMSQLNSPESQVDGDWVYSGVWLTWGEPQPDTAPAIGMAVMYYVIIAVAGAVALVGGGFWAWWWRKRRAAAPVSGKQAAVLDVPKAVEVVSFQGTQGVKPSGQHTQERIEELKRGLLRAELHDGDLQLLQLVGQGTYGKVYKGLWKGTLVAVKVLLLPSGLSGLQRREQMAVMEAAISSSLRHPNIVQTFTYGVRELDPHRPGALPVLWWSATGAAPRRDSHVPRDAGAPNDRSPTMAEEDAATAEDDAASSRLSACSADGATPSSSSNASTPGNPGSSPSAMPLPGERAGLSAQYSIDAASMASMAGEARARAQAPTAGARIPLRAATDDVAANFAADMALGAADVAGDVDGGHCTWEVRLVLEFCNRGSLRAALDRGEFRLPGGGVDVRSVMETALEVARAVFHLHGESVVHGDLKARNVLLTAAVGHRGFVAKVADFGLSVNIDPQDTHVSNLFQGTITHMAPEVIAVGRVGYASDVYAFGVLLWELYTGQHAFRGMPAALLGHAILREGRRPEFPHDCPPRYRDLACHCWLENPAGRPDFRTVVSELQGMLACGQGTPWRTCVSVTPLRGSDMSDSAPSLGPSNPSSNGAAQGGMWQTFSMGDTSIATDTSCTVMVPPPHHRPCLAHGQPRGQPHGQPTAGAAPGPARQMALLTSETQVRLLGDYGDKCNMERPAADMECDLEEGAAPSAGDGRSTWSGSGGRGRRLASSAPGLQPCGAHGEATCGCCGHGACCGGPQHDYGQCGCGCGGAWNALSWDECPSQSLESYPSRSLEASEPSGIVLLYERPPPTPLSLIEEQDDAEGAGGTSSCKREGWS